MKYKILILIFFGISSNSYSQDGIETEVNFPDGTKQTERTFKYPGGKDAFYKDIFNNFEIPKKVKKDKISGKILLKLTVDTLGVIKGEIFRGLRPDIDSAAVQMARKLKKVEPAKQGKKSVRAVFWLPLKI